MRKARTLLVVVVGCIMLTGAWSAWAQDWPQWRGAERDGRPTEFAAPEEWPAELTAAWTVSVGEGDATPALVGDLLYVFTRQGDEEITLCLNAADGSEVWRDAYAAAPVTGPSARHPGSRSSPAVAEGRVVTLGASGVLSCLDAATGEVVWRNDSYAGAVPQFFTASSPIIAGGMVIAQLGSEDGGGVFAFDLGSGEEHWRWDGEGPQYASPVLMRLGDTTQVVTLTARSLVGVNVADGALLWQIPFVPQGRAYNAATPIIDGDLVFYTGAGRGTNAVRIVPGDDGFGVEDLWSNPEIATQFNTPVLEGDLLFGLSQGGTLFCLDAQTGATAWREETQLDRGGFGPMVATTTAIFVLPSSGELIVFAPTGDAYAELARYQVSDTPTFAHPVLAGNRIFVKGQDTLTLWTLP